MDDVVGYWDEQAPGFDEAPDHGLRDPGVRAAWRSLLTAVTPGAPALVADLGCGTGSLAVLLAEAGHRVRGLDLSARMVERARAKAVASGVDVEFSVGDAMRPPWEAGTFDVVLARHVLWALPEPSVGLGRWLELLAPDGRLVLVEGRWWNGAGLPREEAVGLMECVGREAAITNLDDPALWGGPISDDRYLLVSPAGPG